jgi:hypothetical protein
LQEATAADDTNAADWLFLALARHADGQTDAAREALEMARQLITAAAADGPAEDVRPWTARFDHELLLGEAEAVLGGP